MSPDPITRGPLLGVDFGLARTGLASSDEGMRVAFPLEILQGSRRKVDYEIQRICREREIRGAVLGLPRHMDGREGDLAPKVRQLARRIHGRLGIPVWLWDERLTTSEVERRMREAGTRGRPRDDLAATVILQGFLDAKGWKRPSLFGVEEEGTHGVES
jgi:putative Holliday junction resolvase